VAAKTRTVSVYLLRDDVKTATDALLSAPSELDQYQVAAIGKQTTLYVARTPSRPPEWAGLFDGATDRTLEVSRPSYSAVMFLIAEKRMFALTFGAGGRFMLRNGSYERNFGLHVARNLVDPEQIRAVQSRRFSGAALQVRRQSSRESDIYQLDMDTQRDMLTTLQGRIIDGESGTSLSGRDAVRFTDSIDIRRLRPICKQLLKASGSNAYKKRYPWADQFEQITREAEIAKLDTEALTLLLEGKLDRFDVYPAEMVDEAVVDYGLDAGATTTVMEPTRTLLGKLIERSDAKDPEQLGNVLRGRQITARNDEGIAVGRWSWWECLFYESRGAKSIDVLDRGAWLRVRKDFAEAVNSFAAALTPSGLSLPDAKRDDLEDDYNKRVAVERADIRLLDKKLVAPIPGESRIEICDLYSQRGHLVHVKRAKGGSSGFSHLFGQASVSCGLLAEEPAFAEAVREQIGSWGASVKQPPDTSEHPVVLAVMLAAESTGARAAGLPFFSKIFLRQAVQDIRRMGYPVHYDEIPAPVAVATGQRAGGPKPAPRRRRRP
jgi:uncharacterized protein (TIGR04141 family)